MVKDGFQFSGADSVHIHKLFRPGKWSVDASVVQNSLCKSFSDSRQRTQLLQVRPVDINGKNDCCLGGFCLRDSYGVQIILCLIRKCREMNRLMVLISPEEKTNGKGQENNRIYQVSYDYYIECASTLIGKADIYKAYFYSDYFDEIFKSVDVEALRFLYLYMDANDIPVESKIVNWIYIWNLL